MGNIFSRLVKFSSGIFVFSIGNTAFIKSGLGGNPMTVLLEGTSLFLKVSFLEAASLVMTVLIVTILIIDRRRLGLGTLIHSLSVGLLIEWMLSFEFIIIEGQMGSYLALTGGIVLFSLGIALYISADFGEGALDVVVTACVNRFNIGQSTLRIVLDAVMVASGFALGSSVGIGTLTGILFSGPLLRTFKRMGSLHRE